MTAVLSDLQLFGYAIASGIVVAIVCALMSVIVVLKRMAFIGQGVSHAGFGGVGTAIFLGMVGGSTQAWTGQLMQDLLVLTFCVLTAMAIGLLSRRRHLEPDAAIGILLAGTMAWGVLMTDLSVALRQFDWYRQWLAPDSAPPSFEMLLFGDLLNVSATDLALALILGLAVVAILALLFKEMLFFTFDQTSAHVFGVPTGLMHYLLLALLSLTIVLSIRLVGFVLVSALLVVPGATAMLLSQRLGWVFLIALAVGLAGMIFGLAVSIAVGQLSAGACVVISLCGLFAIAFTGRSALNMTRPIAYHGSG